MTVITRVAAREVLDSRGNPTIEVDVHCVDGSSGRALVPSGASVGSAEAVELRDRDPGRYGGKGVLKAVHHASDVIGPELVGMQIEDQRRIDELLIEVDGTANKSKLGANAMLGVSLAVCRGAAEAQNRTLYSYINELADRPPMQLPIPQMNVVNGGAHANNNLDIQEFMLMPYRHQSFHEALRCGAEVFHVLRRLLDDAGLATTVGDEGGYAPNLESNDVALRFLEQAVSEAGYGGEGEVEFALDCAANEIYGNDGFYRLAGEGLRLNGTEWCDYLQDLCVNHTCIRSIEDGLAEDDIAHWKLLTKRTKQSNLQLVGDDVFVTNEALLRQGIEGGYANAILIKPNQAGTLTETLDVILLAKNFGYKTVVSHRSGETEDTTIADLAVGAGADQIKTGSLSRSERIAKYNRLLRIEEEAQDLVYAGAVSEIEADAD